MRMSESIRGPAKESCVFSFAMRDGVPRIGIWSLDDANAVDRVEDRARRTARGRIVLVV